MTRSARPRPRNQDCRAASDGAARACWRHYFRMMRTCVFPSSAATTVTDSDPVAMKPCGLEEQLSLSACAVGNVARFPVTKAVFQHEGNAPAY